MARGRPIDMNEEITMIDFCERKYSECYNVLKYKVIPTINIEAERSFEIFAENTCESEWKLDHVKSALYKRGEYHFVLNIENDCGQYMTCNLIFNESRRSRWYVKNLMCIDDDDIDHIH